VRLALYELQSTVMAGGVQSTMWELGRELARRGHTVHLYGGEGAIREEVAGDFAVRTFPFIPRNRFPDFGTRFRALCERLSLARHAVGPLSQGRYDVIFIRKPYDMPAALLARRRSGARVVYKSGGTEFFPGYRACATRLNAFLACSRFNAEQIQARTGLLPQVHYNGVDPVRFQPRPKEAALASRLRIGPEEFVILSAVRLVGWKGIQIGIEAMQGLRGGRFRYLIVGDGDYRGKLEAQVKAQGLDDCVTIIGSAPRAEIPRYYSLADAAVFPSLGDDAFPNSVVEAMASGVPVVATRSGGIPEAVEDGLTGILVPFRDAGAIGDAVRALAQDADRRRSMGETGRARAVLHFDWKNLTDRLLAVFGASA
jgi:glycosyltransferase involved in cell wall biosynthesis